MKKSARRVSNIQVGAYKGARPRLKTCYPEEKQSILVWTCSVTSAYIMRAQGARTLDSGENLNICAYCDALGEHFSWLSCCSGQRRRPDKKQGTVYKWSVLCFALLFQSFSFFEPFCFVSLKHIFTIIRTRIIAMPLHEALIFVVCPRALATLLFAGAPLLH